MKSTFIHKSLLVLSLALLTIQLSAQDDLFIITDGTDITCTGVFADDGNVGGEGQPYTPGNDYTYTLCPDNPGDVITIEFFAFALYTSPNPNNSDRLFIYDGDDTSAPSLGSYTGNDLQGLSVTGTVNNTSGCLTFVFNSNPNGGGTFPGWEGFISCTTPCATPTSASELISPVPEEGNTLGVCLGEEITFGDAGSFAEPTFNLEYWVWNFDDGTIDTLESPDNITHAFTEPGEYLVSLSVIDNNGCRSLNLEPFQILVSTIPIFNTNFNSPVCINNPVTIDGSPIQSVTWTALPPQVVAGETYLADGAGFSYSSTLTFDFFETDATLENCEDLENIFVNMEHSYLGDLQMSITCPDGTTVVLLPFPNGGGGTFLGEAIDDGSNDPGIGYDYGWSPGLTNGNLDEQENLPNPGGGFGQIVPPGFYQSEEDMCNLVGCPLNGDWTFSVLDNLAIDNGYIFEWGIGFNPLLFPDITTFTPVIGLGPDSTWWEGPNIINTSDDGNEIEVLFTDPGFYEYTFFATNNFNCTFDTTIVIEAVEGPEITAGPNLFVCSDPVQMQAGVVGAPVPACGQDAGTYSYCYENNDNIVVTYCPDDPGDGTTFMTLEFISGFFESFADGITIYNGDDTNAPILADIFLGFDLPGQSFTATNPSGCLTMEIFSDVSISCADGSFEPIEVEISCSANSNIVWSWSPETGLSNPNIQNPMVFVEQATVYTVTAYPEGLPGCIISDDVLVAPDPDADPGIDTDTTICFNSPAVLLTSYLEGTPASGGEWINNNSGSVFPSQFDPSNYPDGVELDLTYTVSNGLCENSAILNLTVLPAIDPSCCQTNAEAGPDAIACALTYQLNAQPTIGTGTWSGPPEVSFSDINDPQAIATAVYPGGVFTLTWTDNNGFLCSESDDITVTFADSLNVEVIPNDAICYQECSGTAIAIVTGGTSDNGFYSFEWSGGEPGQVMQVRDSLCAGFYSILVTDNVGCTDSTTFTIGEPASQEMQILQNSPSCADSCDAKIIVDSEGAVEYSYNGGEEFTASNEGFVCPGQSEIIVRNSAGCEISKEINVNNPPPYIADFNINPNPTTIENTRITFQDISQPGPVAKSLYTFGENPILGEDDSRISVFTFPSDTSGNYAVTLISESVKGCIDTLTQEVIIRDELLWFIPNSFTPNEDGINDIWRPVGNTVDVSDYKLTIFDRWGRQVFTTRDINEGWRGAVQDSEYYGDSQIYNYLIEVTSATTEKKYEITGFITLFR